MPSNEEDLARLKELLPKIEGFLNEATSVIESKKLNEILRESSLRDAMTGLYNRRFMDEYLSKNMPQVLKNKDTVALLMIDMDHFKMVNDTYGHDVGDVIIKKLSKTITENIKESDLAVRYGGEEFLVLLHGVDEPEAIEIAERLRLKVADMKVKAGNEILQKTISIGVSMFPSDTDSVWKCIKFADIALYRAKESGRNRVIRFDEEMWSDDGTGY
jgi:diguanylate cyclase (GGDEF)-like protein